MKSFEKLANKRDSSACEEEEIVIQDFTDHATECKLPRQADSLRLENCKGVRFPSVSWGRSSL